MIAVIDIGFQKISPTPTYPAGVSAAVLSAYSWSSEARSVLAFKSSLKRDLRQAQLGRCCYCRRMLSDDMVTQIEHFVEKAVYPEYTFEISNLALSCATCNNTKNKAFASLCGILSRRASSVAGGPVSIKRCPVLANNLIAPVPLPSNSSDYRWVHPHLDSFGEHLSIQKGWLFRPNSSKGRRAVRALQLNALAQIERRALEERMASRTTPLAIIIGAIAELNHAQARDVCAAVVAGLRRRSRVARI